MGLAFFGERVLREWSDNEYWVIEVDGLTSDLAFALYASTILSDTSIPTHWLACSPMDYRIESSEYVIVPDCRYRLTLTLDSRPVPHA